MLPAYIAFGYAPAPPPWHDPPRWLSSKPFTPYLTYIYALAVASMAFYEGFYAIALAKVWAYKFFYARKKQDLFISLVCALLAVGMTGGLLGGMAMAALSVTGLMGNNVDRAARIVADGKRIHIK